MALRIVHTVPEAKAALATGSTPVVTIPVFNAYADVVQCYEAVFRHTPTDVDVLVVDDGSTDRRVVTVLEGLQHQLHHRVVVLIHDRNQGFVASMNEAFEITQRRDIVLLNSDVIPGPGWLEGLRDAAAESTTTATATAFTNHGTIVSVPYRNTPVSTLPNELTPEEAAIRVARTSRRLRPRIPTAVGHCVYFRRAALDAVGGFDPAFSPGYGEEVDWCQRAVGMGFHHIVADDVFVFHRGGSSFGSSPAARALHAEHEGLIRARYPYYAACVARAATDRYSTLAAAIGQARRAFFGMTVAIDARCLGPVMMGTQLVTCETVRALAAHPGIGQLLVIVPGDLPAYATRAFSGLEHVRILPVGEKPPLEGSVDVVYRPYQVTSEEDITWLRSIGERVVVSQLDLIAFHTPAYFTNFEEWEDYRALTRIATFVADGITWISAYAAGDARQENLVDDSTVSALVYCGTDHLSRLAELTPTCPGDPATYGSGFLVCLGASYLHKNRPFALRVFAQLRERGWTGKIVLVGPLPPHGSSNALEAEFLLQRPDLRDDVIVLRGISESEKLWLYRHAGLVMYPTVTEGFGMVPFEAAQLGVPCLASRQGSLDELLPVDIPTLQGWDIEAATETAYRLLHDRTAATSLCAALVKHGAAFTWAKVAERVVQLFEDVCARPRHRRRALVGEDGGVCSFEKLEPPQEPDPELIAHIDTWRALPKDVREAVRAVAQRPMLRRIFVLPIALGYRVASRMKTRLRL